MKRNDIITLFICVCLACTLCGCFSLMKADHMVYAGSFGKKIDAVIIDSINHYEFNQEGK